MIPAIWQTAFLLGTISGFLIGIALSTVLVTRR
jgi:hypothetical protein